jgi:Protein of unknown function (DUF2934)
MAEDWQEKVRVRAYAIWENAGRPEGGAEQHWGAAEQELRAEAAALNPGDEAGPGTPGAGENICRDCAGTGRRGDEPCPTCNGTGRVIEGIAGG